jgi:hypothetical protein
LGLELLENKENCELLKHNFPKAPDPIKEKSWK